MRDTTERFTGASKKKLGSEDTPEPASTSSAPSDALERIASRSAEKKRGAQARARSLALLVFLWVYQICMAIEARIRDCRADGVLLQDRSFVDDLASILEVFKLETPVALVRFSAHVFPLRRAIYLSAGHEVEFSRIVELDLSKGMHRRKTQRYQEMVRILEEQGVPVKRVSTAPKS
jgi:hypothetical protein